MPVRRLTVPGASPERVVRAGDSSLLPSFIAAARALEAGGARAITTSCGFLVQFQAELQAAVKVPVWSSSLLALPGLRCPGVLTVDAEALNDAHWRAAGADPRTPVQGLAAGCHLQRCLLDNLDRLDAAQAEADLLLAACALVERHPQIETLVLECTNMPPYADAVARATGRTVQHLITFVESRWKALSAT